ncbi:hypothetical protein HY500_00785 [Candidatus Woesearchaeota archaeon]|nr:hypothetical protein [Candidatus Woesearchaeota archaeon]
MATVIDISLLRLIAPIFSFIFVFTLVYAMMDKFKLVGDNKGIHAAIAFSIAMVFLFAGDAMRFVSFITPWFIIMLVVGLFIISFFVFFGVSTKVISEQVMTDPRVYWTIIIISIIILFVSIGQVFGSDLPGQFDESGKKIVIEGDSGSATSEGLQAIVHPRVLGALFLLIIAAFAIRLISENVVPMK